MTRRLSAVVALLILLFAAVGERQLALGDAESETLRGYASAYAPGVMEATVRWR